MGRKKTHPLIENIEIQDIASEGKALARHEGLVIFIQKDGVPGDVVDLQVVRKKRRYMEAVPVTIHRYSDKRATPFCRHFGVCGGCKWQNLPYPEQLKYKQKQVSDQLSRIGRLTIPPISDILPAPETRYYRNKLEFTFSNRRWLTEEEISRQGEIGQMNALGLHIPGRFDKVLDLEVCYLQPHPSNAIRLAVRDYAIRNHLSFFDIREQEGLLRNLIIRTATTGEVMVIVSFFQDEPGSRDALLAFLQQSFPEITSLMYVINSKANDSIFDLAIHPYAGKDHLMEKIGNLFFRVGPVSFFQTNSRQTHQLYEKVREFADFKGDELVYDLYTGIGAIANYIAGDVRQVTGIESIPEAVKYAVENARINQITNTAFFSGDMKHVLTPEFIREQGKPEVVILDPPRAGVHTEVLQQLLEASPDKIIYVSCNPATQARDLELLSEKYVMDQVQPVDMFPHTMHVENMVRLIRK